MPLQYDDVPGSWGTHSTGWPETPYSIGKWLLCTKALVIPYGSYVVVGAKGPHPYDYSDAVIRVETEAFKKKLEDAHRGMFVECKHLLKEEFA